MNQAVLQEGYNNSWSWSGSRSLSGSWSGSRENE